MSSSCATKEMPAMLGGKRKTHGGKRNGGKRKTEGGKRKTEGGKRKTRRGPSDWNKFVMKVFKEMKAADSSASFSQALTEASKRKKAGKQ